MDLKFIVVGDANSSGGVVLAGSSQHLIQGQGIARLGDAVDCPARYPDGRPHGVNPIVQGDETCLIDGRPVALHGFKSACGCTLVGRVTVTRSLGRMVERGAPSPSAVESNPLVVSSATASDTTPTPKHVAQGRINTKPGSVVVVQDGRLAKPWRISERGKAFIASFEKLRTTVYLDQAGLATIGIGHLITAQEMSAGIYRNGITQQQAMNLFDQDLVRYEARVSNKVDVPLHQHEFDALVALTYNVWSALGAHSEIANTLNAGAYQDVAAIILRFSKYKDTKRNAMVSSKGLEARRRAEADLFLHGNYALHA